MKASSLTVFDEYVVGPTPVFTALVHGEALSRADQLAIQAIADDAVGTRLSLSVRIEHSRDGSQDAVGPFIHGSRWQPLNARPEIDAVPIAIGERTVASGGEPWPARPRHRHVRLRIQLHDSPLTTAVVAAPAAFSARVAIHVTARSRTTRFAAPPTKRTPQQRAVVELRQLLAAARGLPQEQQRDYVLSLASDDTLAHLQRAARSLRAMNASRLDRMRRRAAAVVELLDRVRPEAAACEPCEATSATCASCDDE